MGTVECSPVLYIINGSRDGISKALNMYHVQQNREGTFKVTDVHPGEVNGCPPQAVQYSNNIWYNRNGSGRDVDLGLELDSSCGYKSVDFIWPVSILIRRRKTSK